MIIQMNTNVCKCIHNALRCYRAPDSCFTEVTDSVRDTN